MPGQQLGKEQCANYHCSNSYELHIFLEKSSLNVSLWLLEKNKQYFSIVALTRYIQVTALSVLLYLFNFL